MAATEKSSLLNRYRLYKLRRILAKINALASHYKDLSDEELKAETNRFKQRLAAGETLDAILPEAFATIREANRRILGMFPFDVQVLGGIVLHQGKIAEMRTGEGKTLTATMPLYLNALTGKGAILVTVNDYLAKRDAEEMKPVYEFLGLSVGVGVFDEDEDPSTEVKKAVYDSDIVYSTSTALGFDYLTDNLVGDQNSKFLRPFNYVIVDEVDAVLLDMAQTPLIISGSPRVPSNFYQVADLFVQTLKEDEEYKYKKDDKVVYLTDKGADYAQIFFEIDDLYSEASRELYRQIMLALRAHKLYKKDYDYVVVDDEVKLLDNRTGRVLEGTRMQSGIHQAIETKEGVKNTKETRATASVTYQSLFNMFPKISGMTGTGKTAEDELIDTYQLEVVVIPTNRPVQRIDYPDKVYTTLPEKLYATIEEVKSIHATGQPILLISGTVEVAEIYSRMLLQEGIAHNLLTAKNAAKEVQIVKEAGQIGNVTVATPMAARGTDIKLGDNVDDLGGLAVIGTERLQNRRQDLQVMGRAGRQGAPGRSQFFVSLEDELLLTNGPSWAKTYFEKRSQTKHKHYGQELTKGRFKRAVNHAQAISEDKEVSARANTVQLGESLDVQRNLIYQLRDKVMFNDIPVRRYIDTIFEEEIERVARDMRTKNRHDLRRYILDNYAYHFVEMPSSVDTQKPETVKNLLWHLYQSEKDKKEAFLFSVKQIYEFYCLSILKAIDEAWVEEVDHLQQLKGIVNTRPIGQRNNIVEYNMESYDIYQYMGEDVKHMVVRNVMLSTLNKDKDGHLSIYYV